MSFESADYLVRFAVYTGAFTTLVTLLMVLLMLVVRVSRSHESWMGSTVTTRWLEVLGGSSGAAIVADLPSLRRRTAFLLLRQWSVAYDRDQTQTTDPNSASRLRQKVEAATHVRLDQFALELLETGTNEEIMAASIVLGQLGLEKAWIPLKRRATAEHPFISAVALQALVRIDPERAVPVLIEALTTHLTEPDHVLARMLGELSEMQIHEVVAGVVDMGSFEPTLHLFRALERRGEPAAGVVLEWLIAHLRSVDDVKACCYAALQEDRLNRVIRLYHDGVERAGELAETEQPVPDDEPMWIRRHVMAIKRRQSDIAFASPSVRSRVD